MMVELFEYQELLYATDGFSPARLIGKGSHGSVYKAILEDDTVVAVKKPLESKMGAEAWKKLENEARVLSGLGHNPLVVNFLGTSVEKKRKQLQLLVMEFMPNGSLHDLVAAPLTWPKRLQIITQIARALQFLHDDLVIHRDIKPQNILFDSHWNLKLADFGLAVVTKSESGQPAGTIGYLDPCYTAPSKLSTKTDVFSFGVVLLEVMSGRKAMDVSKSPASIVEWARPLIEDQNYQAIYDKRMGVPKYLEGATRKALDMGGRCVCPDQWKRPSMGEIVEAIAMEITTTTTLCCIQPLTKLFPLPVWSSLVRRRRKQGKRRPFNSKFDCVN